MRFYVEIFSKNNEELDGYIQTDLTPEIVAEVYDEHPVGTFELDAEIASRLGIQHLDFDTKDYFLTAAREVVDEHYEYQGEILYPPPMFLPDVLNANPVRPK